MKLRVTYWVKLVIFMTLLFGAISTGYAHDNGLARTENVSVEDAQGQEMVQSWAVVVKHLHPKIHLNPNILERISSIRTGGKIPVDKFDDALNKQLGQILNSADEVNANKILDRLQEAHVNEKHFDALVERLENPDYLTTLVQDLKNNPDWFETFDDIILHPDKYWDILSEGNIVAGTPMAKWGQGHWWKNLRTLAKNFEEGVALDKVEDLFGSTFGSSITLRVTNNNTGEVLDIVPDFLASKTNKIHIIDAKYTTKELFNPSDALTPNQGKVFSWLKSPDDLKIEVRAANDRLENIPGIQQGSILSKSDIKVDIIKSGQGNHNIVDSVINYH